MEMDKHIKNNFFLSFNNHHFKVKNKTVLQRMWRGTLWPFV